MRVLGQGLEFVAWIVLARRLGTSGFGSLSLAFLVCRYAGLVADWGASLRGPRDVASPGQARQVAMLVRRRAGVAVLLTALVAGGTVVVHQAVLAPLALTVLGRGVGRDWVALGRGRGMVSGIPLVAQGFLAVGMTLFVHSTAGAAIAIGAAYAAGAAFSVALNRLGELPASVDVSTKGPHAWVLVAVLTDQVSATMDTILLAALRSVSSAGVYAAVYRLPNAWLAVVGVMTMGLLPLVTRAAATESADFEELVSRSRRLAACGAGALLAAAPLAFLAVPLLLGPAYGDGRLPVAVLLVAAAVTTLSAPLQPVFLALGGDRELAVISCAGAAASLLSYVLLIPPLGPSGAALGTLLGQATLLALFRWRLPALLARWRGQVGVVGHPARWGREPQPPVGE